MGMRRRLWPCRSDRRSGRTGRHRHHRPRVPRRHPRSPARPRRPQRMRRRPWCTHRRPPRWHVPPRHPRWRDRRRRRWPGPRRPRPWQGPRHLRHHGRPLRRRPPRKDVRRTIPAADGTTVRLRARLGGDDRAWCGVLIRRRQTIVRLASVGTFKDEFEDHFLFHYEEKLRRHGLRRPLGTPVCRQVTVLHSAGMGEADCHRLFEAGREVTRAGDDRATGRDAVFGADGALWTARHLGLIEVPAAGGPLRSAPAFGLISLRCGEKRLYSAPSHTETWLKRPSGGNRAARHVCSHVSGGTNRRIQHHGAT
jgi:hypothetical protein